jgi:hypothetical protein
MNKLLLASAALATLVAAPAFATTQVTVLSASPITVPPTAVFSPSVTTVDGNTDLFYEFELGSAMTLSAASFTNSAVPGSAFAFSSVTVYKNTSGYGANGGSQVFTPYTSGQQLTANLMAGKYTIDVKGTATGTSTVGSSFVFTTPAVPEAATWAMMLVGFGGIGGALRSSRRKVSFA